MLVALCVLLPAIVVGAQDRTTPPLIQVTIPIGGPDITVVAGVWKETGLDGEKVILHDGDKWTAKEGYPLALFRNPRSFSNGTAMVDFKLLKGGDDYSGGIVFGHTGGTTYYYARYNTKDGDVAIWRMDGPKRTVLSHGDAKEQLAKDAWHTLELAVDGRKVRASVNGGKLAVEHELDAPVTGRLGLWTKTDVTTAFRNLRVARR